MIFFLECIYLKIDGNVFVRKKNNSVVVLIILVWFLIY